MATFGVCHLRLQHGYSTVTCDLVGTYLPREHCYTAFNVNASIESAGGGYCNRACATCASDSRTVTCYVASQISSRPSACSSPPSRFSFTVTTMANLNRSRLIWSRILVCVMSVCSVAVAHSSVSSASRATDEPASLVWTWGPYRPNLYFGIRPQVPKTLLLGLMWANGDNRTSMLNSTDSPKPIFPRPC
jgi:hypothetical protein